MDAPSDDTRITEARRRPTFEDLVGSRDNNLQLLRMLAATGVLVSHAPLIAQGRDAVPWAMWTLGYVCVGAFFAISGFLVSASFERSRSSLDFLAARLLRILPGLLACVLLSALVMGPMVTSLPVGRYLMDPGTLAFVAGNAMVFWDVEELPGVFAAHPNTHAQITLWTLKHEVVAYLAVLVLGLLGVLRRRLLATALLCVYVLFSAALLRIEIADAEALPEWLSQLRRVSSYFVAGMVVYGLRRQVRPSALLCAALLVLLLLAWAPIVLGGRSEVWRIMSVQVLLPITTVQCVLWLALVPAGPIRAYNRVGDYSYGVYVFGVPVQQLAVVALGSHGPATNLGFAALPTLCLAVVSWHLLEKPCLGLRHRLVPGASMLSAARRLRRPPSSPEPRTERDPIHDTSGLPGASGEEPA